MLRRLLNSVIETTLQPYQPESAIYSSPFTQKDILHLSWLSAVAPCYPVNSKNITILTEPDQFYNTLLENCANAKDRITLVSLYLGNGSLERKLVKGILDNDNFKNGSLQTNVLLDYTRGSRYKTNSRTMLRPLLEKNDVNCTVALYHTPVLRGLRKRLMPDRFNEIFGLQHMKLYIFDDTLIISGANLSNDYFTNRQDRYFVIKDRELSNFYCGLVSLVQSFSLVIDKNDNVRLREGWNYLPYEGSKTCFVSQASDLVQNYLLDAKDKQNICKREGFDTWLFPLVQMGQLGVEHDAEVTTRILSDAPPGSLICMATGYFNLTQQYINTIIKESSAQFNLLMAHPDANGFQGASGMAGGIPAAYSLLAQKFKQQLETLGQSDRITMQEYLRRNWTYHAKGLWYYPPQTSSPLPSMTLIGSPNFGERSVKRDLETQLAVVTESPELRKQMHEECHRLYSMGLPADLGRDIPKWVYAMVMLFKGYF